MDYLEKVLWYAPQKTTQGFIENILKYMISPSINAYIEKLHDAEKE